MILDVLFVRVYNFRTCHYSVLNSFLRLHVELLDIYTSNFFLKKIKIIQVTYYPQINIDWGYIIIYYHRVIITLLLQIHIFINVSLWLKPVHISPLAEQKELMHLNPHYHTLTIKCHCIYNSKLLYSKFSTWRVFDLIYSKFGWLE